MKVVALDPEDFPERLILRDTEVFADEGQRIFTTATGYGYTKCEYVRADEVEYLKQRIRELEEGSYGWEVNG